MSIIKSKKVDLYQKLVRFEPNLPIFGLFRPIFDINQPFRSNLTTYSRSEFEVRFEFRIEIVAMIDQTAKFGSKMLIKTRFESD